MKRAAVLAAVALAAAGMVAAAAPPSQKARPAARDWTGTVAMTPEGGFRMGNPAAPVKLVEYGSLTCSTCAAFSNSAKPDLLGRYVKTGKVSFEFRTYVLNGVDIAASLLARCGGPSGFFRVADRLYATQGQWVGRIRGMSPAQKEELNSLSRVQRLNRMADIGGLIPLAAEAGVTPQKSRQCLADEAALTRLGEIHQAGVERHGVDRTPTFLLNGAKIDAHSWPAIEPLIRQAGG